MNNRNSRNMVLLFFIMTDNNYKKKTKWNTALHWVTQASGTWATLGCGVKTLALCQKHFLRLLANSRQREKYIWLSSPTQCQTQVTFCIVSVISKVIGRHTFKLKSPSDCNNCKNLTYSRILLGSMASKLIFINQTVLIEYLLMQSK